MARTVIPRQVVTGPGLAINSITWTNFDQANGMYFDNSDEGVSLLVKCTDGTEKVIDVDSVADDLGRSLDTTITCPATTGFSFAGRFPARGFNQRGASDLGRVHLNAASGTGLQVAAVVGWSGR